MPNLSVGLSSMSAMSAMPILTPIPVNPPMYPVQPLVPTPMTLPLISSLGNPGLPNGNVNLLPPPLVPSHAGWFCRGTTLICLWRQNNQTVTVPVSCWREKTASAMRCWCTCMIYTAQSCSLFIPFGFIFDLTDLFIPSLLHLSCTAAPFNLCLFKHNFWPSNEQSYWLLL